MTGRRERKKEATRRALLDASFALFSERGIYGTRLEDITELADIGKGAFYNYYSSKDAIIADLVAEGVARLDQDYLQQVGRKASPEDQVAAVVEAHQAFFSDNPQYVLLFHQARGLLKVKQEGQNRLQQVFLDYLERLGRSLPETTDPLDQAAAVAGTVAGYRSIRLAAGLDVHPETPTRTLRQGLVAKTPAKA